MLPSNLTLIKCLSTIYTNNYSLTVLNNLFIYISRFLKEVNCLFTSIISIEVFLEFKIIKLWKKMLFCTIFGLLIRQRFWATKISKIGLLKLWSLWQPWVHLSRYEFLFYSLLVGSWFNVHLLSPISCAYCFFFGHTDRAYYWYVSKGIYCI